MSPCPQSKPAFMRPSLMCNGWSILRALSRRVDSGGGSLGDLFGRRLIFIVGIAIFALASAACGAALNIHQLIIARSIQGVGAALLVPGSLSIISASFDEKSRGQAIGTWSGFTAITTAVGPVLGGWLVQHASWRWVFLIDLSSCGSRDRHFGLEDSGEPRRQCELSRLAGRIARHSRTRRFLLRGSWNRSV